MKQAKLKPAKCKSCGRKSYWLIVGRCIECHSKARREQEALAVPVMGPSRGRAWIEVYAMLGSCEHSQDVTRKTEIF
jgi:hypothetical protein